MPLIIEADFNTHITMLMVGYTCGFITWYPIDEKIETCSSGVVSRATIIVTVGVGASFDNGETTGEERRRGDSKITTVGEKALPVLPKAWRIRDDRYGRRMWRKKRWLGRPRPYLHLLLILKEKL